MNFAELAAPGFSSAKQAALMVHAMSPADRDWVLGRLSVQQRHALEDLLAELTSLGVVKDPEFITSELRVSSLVPSERGEAVASLQADVHKPDAGLPDEEYLADLTPFAVERLSRLWSAEPAALVAVALQAHSWPWHTQLLERLPVLHRRKVEGLLALSPAYACTELAKAILQVTRERMEQAVEQGTMRGKAERGRVVQRNTQELLNGYGERGLLQESCNKRAHTAAGGSSWELLKVRLSRWFATPLRGFK